MERVSKAPLRRRNSDSLVLNLVVCFVLCCVVVCDVCSLLFCVRRYIVL